MQLTLTLPRRLLNPDVLPEGQYSLNRYLVVVYHIKAPVQNDL